MNQTYVVKKGDTLYGISNQFGVSVDDLKKINNLSTNNLQIGQVLTIPNNSGDNPSNIILYTVKKGDTLYSIANIYNTTVNELINLNKLTTNNLSINQVLKIPESYNDEVDSIPNFINYIVKKGDTLYNIANNNNITLDTIIKDNALNSNNLSIGQILKIRVQNNENLNDYEECFGEDYNPITDNINTTYIVKKGDSLYKVANLYNISVSELMKYNNLTNTNLSIGQILKIPSIKTENIQVYTVKKGDSLYSISKKYNTTVDNIKKMNNLTSNNLAVGQKLFI